MFYEGEHNYIASIFSYLRLMYYVYLFFYPGLPFGIDTYLCFVPELSNNSLAPKLARCPNRFFPLTLEQGKKGGLGSEQAWQRD